MNILKTIWMLFVLVGHALGLVAASTAIGRVWKNGILYCRYADGSLLPVMAGADTASEQAKVRELSTKHATIITEVKELRDANQGKTMSAEDQAKHDKALDNADTIKAELDGVLKTAEDDQRFAGHLDYGRKGAGHVDLGGGGDPDGGGGVSILKSVGGAKVSGIFQETKDGMVTVEVDGKTLPLFSTKQLITRPDLVKTMAPEYKSAFDQWVRGDLDAQKALTPSSDSSGGYLVPADFLARVIQRLPGAAVVEENATVITTQRDMVRVPRVKVASADSTMYSSNVKFSMVGPAETLDSEGSTEPVFEGLDTQVWDAKMDTQLNRNLIADAAFDVGGYLAQEFRQAATLGKDDKYLTGTGVKEPLGIVNDADVASVSSGSAAALTADGLKDLVYTPPAQYHNGARLALSLSALKAIRKLKDSNNRYLWEPGFGGTVGGAPATIEGFPYSVTDFLDSVGAGNKPIIFGNFRFYWAIIRAEMSLQVLREVRARFNEDVYLAFVRFGGNIAVPQAFAYQTVEA